jgi:hypothetical protein
MVAAGSAILVDWLARDRDSVALVALVTSVFGLGITWLVLSLVREPGPRWRAEGGALKVGDTVLRVRAARVEGHFSDLVIVLIEDPPTRKRELGRGSPRWACDTLRVLATTTTLMSTQGRRNWEAETPSSLWLTRALLGLVVAGFAVALATQGHVIAAVALLALSLTSVVALLQEHQQVVVRVAVSGPGRAQLWRGSAGRPEDVTVAGVLRAGRFVFLDGPEPCVVSVSRGFDIDAAELAGALGVPLLEVPSDGAH